MKKFFIVALASIMILLLFACASTAPSEGTQPPMGATIDKTKPSNGTELNDSVTDNTDENYQVFITIGNTVLSTTLEENSATVALNEKLKIAPITIDMSDYGGWEKVGSFGFDLPKSNRQITAKPCDFVLYQGNQLVIFYGTNSWSYTPLGKITGVTPEELKNILGNGNVTVTLSLSKKNTSI